MDTPLKHAQPSIDQDHEWVKETLKGNRQSMECLVSKYQRWIYNIAVRMTVAFSEAEDITQEVLVKMLTKLSTFDPEKGTFRSWVNRIAANHIISYKRSSTLQGLPGGFDEHGKRIDSIPMEELPAGQYSDPERRLLVKEAQYGCMTSMLLCFKPKERLIYILGEIFNITSQEGAEILEITPDSFRKTLSRARKSLAEFMDRKCSVVNSSAKCHCQGKIMPHFKTGRLKPGELRFNQPDQVKIRDLVQQSTRAMNDLITAGIQELHRELPYFEPGDTTTVFKKILNHPKYASLFQ